MRCIAAVVVMSVLVGISAAQDESVFVTAELDRTRAFAGEQVIYTVTAYTDAARDVVFLPPDFEGFWQGEVRSFRGSATRSGKQYEAAIFQVSLYALTEGILTIGTPRAQFDDAVTGQSMTASGEALTIDIVAVPPGPDTFGGLVGVLDASLRAEPTTIRLGEAVRITLTLSGSANLETNPAPAVIVPTSWRVYSDSTAAAANFDGALATQDLTLRWLAVPDEAGSVQVDIAPITVFDPRTGFIDVKVPPVRVDVLAAADGSIRRQTRGTPAGDGLALVFERPATPPPPGLLWVAGPALAAAALGLPSLRRRVSTARRRRRARLALTKFKAGLRSAVSEGRVGRIGEAVRIYLADVGVREPRSIPAAAAVLTELESWAYAPDPASVVPLAVERAAAFVRNVEERRHAVGD